MAQATASARLAPAIENIHSQIAVSRADSAATTTTTATRLGDDGSFAFLDGLRGLLCMIVVSSHWFLMGLTVVTNAQAAGLPAPRSSVFFGDWLHHTPLRLFVAGEFGVATFFVLSGFVVVARFLHRPQEERSSAGGRSMGAAALRRLPRLFIPSTFALLLYFAVMHFAPWWGYWLCHHVGDLGGTTVYSLPDILLNAIAQYLFAQPLYGIEWTMQVEWVGSLLVYGLAYTLTRSCSVRRRLALPVLISLQLILPIVWLATSGGVPVAVQYMPPFWLGLALSVLTAGGHVAAVRQMRSSSSVKERLIYWMLVSIVLLLAVYCGSYPVFNTTVVHGAGTLWVPLGWMYGWGWLCLGGGCLVSSALLLPELQWFLSTRPVLFLGRTSFGVYLLHYTVLCAVDATLMPLAAASMGADVAAVVLLFTVILPVTLACAWLFYIFVDGPAVGIAHYVADRLLTGCGCCSSQSTRAELQLQDTEHAQDGDALLPAGPAKQATLRVARCTTPRYILFTLSAAFVVLLAIGAVPSSPTTCPAFTS